MQRLKLRRGAESYSRPTGLKLSLAFIKLLKPSGFYTYHEV